VYEPTGRLVIEFADHDWAYRGRRRRWGDTKRWRLDDKLGEILGEVEARAALLKQRRRQEDEARARRQQQWEAAMRLARSRYHDAVRREALRAQIDAWEEACRVRRFCDHLDQVADNSDAERQTRSAHGLRGDVHTPIARTPAGGQPCFPSTRNPARKTSDPTLADGVPTGPRRTATAGPGESSPARTWRARLNPHRGSVERLEGAGITWVRECVLQLQPKLGGRLVDGEAVLPQLGGASEQV
jgi:hypothetical protein